MRVTGIAYSLATAFWATAAIAQAPEAVAVPTASDPRPAYEANLTACVKRVKACDRSRLSATDRDYIVYEMGEQRFSAKDAEEIVAVRMEAFGRPGEVIQGKATGDRHGGILGYPREANPSGSAGGHPVHTGNCTVHVPPYVRHDGTPVAGYDRRSGRC